MMSRHALGNEQFVIRPYSWQLYGRYADGSVWAGAVRASNRFMACQAILDRLVAPLKAITYCEPVRPLERAEKDRKRYRRDNPQPA